MAKVKLGEYLKDNICVVKTLVKSGQMPTDILYHFQIYNFFESTKDIKSKMERYEFTAEQFKMPSRSVRHIVSKMEKLV